MLQNDYYDSYTPDLMDSFVPDWQPVGIQTVDCGSVYVYIEMRLSESIANHAMTNIIGAEIGLIGIVPTHLEVQAAMLSVRFNLPVETTLQRVILAINRALFKFNCYHRERVQITEVVTISNG